MGLDVNLPALYAAEEAGHLKTFIAENDGKVAGYDCLLVSEDVYKAKRMAATEVGIYMIPRFRGHYGKDFIQWVDSQLEVDIIYRGTSVSRDFGKVLEKLGYFKLSNIYGKEKNGTGSGNRATS
jgi:hypothetical protein